MVNYDAYATTFSNSRKSLQWPELDTIIEDMCECGYTSVLDIGCGNGRFLTEIQDSKFNEVYPVDRIQNYIGLDSSAGMIAEAKKLHPDYEFAVCPMESL
jgi:trans-aconitate methyltransferase